MNPKALPWRLTLLFGVLLALMLAGCDIIGGALPATATVAPTGTTAPATPVPATETAAPPTVGAPTETAAPATETTAPEPTAAPQLGPLPDPVYFISAADGQIWRVARDGTTLTQITREAAPVTYYDVSPADGGLVYISENTFILADGEGGNRRPLFGGPQEFGEDRINNELFYPRFSPDGRKIAFGYAGIQILDLDDPMLAPNVLIPSDAFPDPNAGRPPVLLRFYRQAIWSPDSARLLVEYLHYPEGGGWAILLLNADGDGALVDVQAPPEGGILCCEPTWSLDSAFIYIASPYIGLGSPGLWRVPAATGPTETLIAPEGEAYYMVRKAQQLADGNLYFFMGQMEGFPTGLRTPQTIYRAGLDASNATPLRTDSYRLEEVLWAPDASGAVIMEVSDESVFPYHGPLTWVPADGSAAVRLPADGSSLLWGR
jgi:hypothetical protein